MNDIAIGEGGLDGRGVYAGRDFVAGEPLLAYALRPIDEVEYQALPVVERLFVHSYGGRRYLYPLPARYVNHSEQPTAYEDFDRGCYVALRDIAAREPITIDATQETARELATFLDAYGDALSSRSSASLGALIEWDAVHWHSGVACRGRDAVVAELLAVKFEPLSQVQWLVGTGRWEAVCSADTVGAQAPRHLTMLLKVVQGNWQISYQHIG
jgi:hypothetical protein